MSQVIFGPNTKNVLNSVIPKWMKKLTSVNFDGSDLDDQTRYDMNKDREACFIGELHKGDPMLDYCDICRILSDLAPVMFKTIGHVDSDRNGYEPQEDLIALAQDYKFEFDKLSDLDVITFLNGVSQHIEDDHWDLYVLASHKAKIEGDK